MLVLPHIFHDVPQSVILFTFNTVNLLGAHINLGHSTGPGLLFII
jgi:hypothetical protein